MPEWAHLRSWVLDFIVRTPHEGGGTIYSNGFFVQSILADRYFNRREMSGIIKKLVQRRIKNSVWSIPCVPRV